MIVLDDPSTGEHSTYKRAPVLLDFHTNTVTLRWRAEQGTVIPDGTPATLLIDGVPSGEGVFKGNLCTITSTVANGHRLAELQCVMGQCYPKAILVNSGAPLEDQSQYVATNRFEATYGPHPIQSAKVPYNPRKRTLYKLKERPIETYSERLPWNKLWVHRVGLNVAARLTRDFSRGPTGDAVVETLQKYFHADATNPPSIEPPVIALYDGDRTEATLGHLYNSIARRGRKGWYHCDTSGRVAFEFKDGKVLTLFGWRIKPGEKKYHSGMIDPGYMNGKTPAQKKSMRELYNSAWELLGDWQVRGPKGLLEPWQLVVAMRVAGKIDKRNGAEGWVCDTLNHRVPWWSFWTNHPEKYEAAHFPPKGYVSPPAPTGQTTIYDFLFTPDGKPTEYLNEPFGADINPADERFYWSNHGNDSIWSCKLDGTDIQPFWISPVHYTYRDLGSVGGLVSTDPAKSGRMGYVKPASLAFNRTLVKDGPLGAATLIKPNAIKFSHDGKYMYVTEQYTYMLRMVDMETRTVVKSVPIPGVQGGSSSASTNECGMDIDNEGTCGPVDDIRIPMWRGYAHFDKDLNFIDAFPYTSGAEMSHGPLNMVNAPDYGWNISSGDGQIRITGNAAGFNDIFVTKRREDDPDPDLQLWVAGQHVFMHVLGLTHGSSGQARLGYPTIEELGARSEEELRAYWRAHAEGFNWLSAVGTKKHAEARTKVLARGLTAEDAFVYFVRWDSIGVDYSAVEAPPVEVPPPPPPTDAELLALEREKNARLEAEKTALQADNALMQTKIGHALAALS